MDDEHAHEPHDPDAGPGGVDPLLEVRAALDEVDRLRLEERAEVFEQTHRVVVDELRALEQA